MPNGVPDVTQICVRVIARAAVAKADDLVYMPSRNNHELTRAKRNS
jgi:hypothetical protein